MYAAVAAGVVVVVALAVWWWRRDSGYKVDEFARARSLTTEWARRAGADQPGAGAPAEPQSAAPQSVAGPEPRAGDRARRDRSGE